MINMVVVKQSIILSSSAAKLHKAPQRHNSATPGILRVGCYSHSMSTVTAGVQVIMYTKIKMLFIVEKITGMYTTDIPPTLCSKLVIKSPSTSRVG